MRTCSVLTLALAALASLSAEGCGPPKCTDNGSQTIGLVVVDASGAGVADAIVSFSVAGGLATAAACTARVSDGCSRWAVTVPLGETWTATATRPDDGATTTTATATASEACDDDGEPPTLTLTVR